MSHSQRYALWMYEDVKTIKEDKLYLVRNKQTEELAVKRYIRKELIPVYQALKEKRSLYLPIIYEIQIENLRGIVITEFIQGITLQKILDETKEQLLSQDGLMFDGVPATEEDVQKIIMAMQMGMEMIKKENKAKFTPKKYRKNN